jgi:hypothetical protein
VGASKGRGRAVFRKTTPCKVEIYPPAVAIRYENTFGAAVRWRQASLSGLARKDFCT